MMFRHNTQFQVTETAGTQQKGAMLSRAAKFTKIRFFGQKQPLNATELELDCHHS